MIQVANAPCSWGVLEFDLEGEVAGCDQVLDEMQASGYAGTELGDWGFMPTDPEALADTLAKRSLQLLGGFVPVRWLDAGKAREGRDMAVKTAGLMRDAGFSDAFIVLADDNGTDGERTAKAGRITEREGWSASQWKEASGAIDTCARAVLEATGLRSVFHHHAAGFVETPKEIECLLDATDPELVGLVLDTGHAAFGGGEAIDLWERYRERVWHVHFKDFQADLAKKGASESWDYFRAVREGVFCKLGEGHVNFPGVVEALRRDGYEGWVVVEQDVLPGMGAPKACAEHNRTYLKGLGL